MKRDPNCCLHLIAVEKRRSRASANSSSVRYEPEKTLRDWDKVNAKRGYVNADFANIVMESVAIEIRKHENQNKIETTIEEDFNLLLQEHLKGLVEETRAKVLCSMLCEDQNQFSFKFKQVLTKKL